jgi:hypothetical protein
MFSLETINYLNQQAAKKARKHRRKPYVPDGPEAVESWPPFPFPLLGDYDPPGWERTENCWFTDKSGWGRDEEPALTWRQLKDQLQDYIAENPGHGFAITEEGQFQLYITAFCRIPTRNRKRSKRRAENPAQQEQLQASLSQSRSFSRSQRHARPPHRGSSTSSTTASQ